MHAVWMLMSLTGCGEEDVEPAVAVAEPTVDAPAEVTPEPIAEAAPANDPVDTTGRIAARHILVAWQGTVGAESTLRRSRAEAKTNAERLLTRLQSGEDFAALAREASDGPSRVLGGDLGPFEADAMHPDFSTAAFSLSVDEISGLVETPFGFHLIQRVALDEVHVAHVLVQWTGVARSEVERTQEEAHARAEEARARLVAGEPISTVAGELSDGPTGVRGGDLGWFQRGQMVPAFDEAAFSLSAGGISKIVESPLGYHVIVRVE
ncbi:MAG: parvulin-like peptidyl-prolyl isomerase [Myxococcota bacterium]|jgi:parvulin-like peptidyl-prolyl isomerase